MISTPEYYQTNYSTVTISIVRRQVQSCKLQHINLINMYEEDGYGKITRSEDRKLLQHSNEVLGKETFVFKKSPSIVLK